MPSTELLEAMGKYNEELVNAGMLLSGEGLQPSSHGARVAFSGADRTVTDGPFLSPGSWWPALDLTGRGHGRGHRVGKALSQSNARPQRN